MADVDSTLSERGARYGDFMRNAGTAQLMKGLVRSAPQWVALAYDQKQALDVICDKIARILGGDPDYADNWHDIAGYARLVERRLEEEA